jgi:hypothetical protein
MEGWAWIIAAGGLVLIGYYGLSVFVDLAV